MHLRECRNILLIMLIISASLIGGCSTLVDLTFQRESVKLIRAGGSLQGLALSLSIAHANGSIATEDIEVVSSTLVVFKATLQDSYDTFKQDGQINGRTLDDLRTSIETYIDGSFGTDSVAVKALSRVLSEPTVASISMANEKQLVDAFMSSVFDTVDQTLASLSGTQI